MSGAHGVVAQLAKFMGNRGQTTIFFRNKTERHGGAENGGLSPVLTG
jgi:hypothetical protein